MSTEDRYGRSLAALWKAALLDHGELEDRVCARLDSGEYVEVAWKSGGPNAGWLDLIVALGDREFDVTPEALDATTLGEEETRAAHRARPSARLAYVSELIGDGGTRPLGRFAAHVEGPDSLIDELDEADFLAAVEWAGARADTVRFRPGGGNAYYTVRGEPRAEMPAWPGDVIPVERPNSTPLDGSVAERPWLFCATGRAGTQLPEVLGAVVRDHVVGRAGWSALLEVRAARGGDAMRDLDEALNDAPGREPDDWIGLSAGTHVDRLLRRRP